MEKSNWSSSNFNPDQQKINDVGKSVRNIIEVIFEKRGHKLEKECVDWYYLDINPTWNRQIIITKEKPYKISITETMKPVMKHDKIGFGMIIPNINNSNVMIKEIIFEKCKYMYYSVIKFLSLTGYMKVAISSTSTSKSYDHEHYDCRISFDCWDDIKNQSILSFDQLKSINNNIIIYKYSHNKMLGNSFLYRRDLEVKSWGSKQVKSLSFGGVSPSNLKFYRGDLKGCRFGSVSPSKRNLDSQIFDTVFVIDKKHFKFMTHILHFASKRHVGFLFITNNCDNFFDGGNQINVVNNIILFCSELKKFIHGYFSNKCIEHADILQIQLSKKSENKFISSMMYYLNMYFDEMNPIARDWKTDFTINNMKQEQEKEQEQEKSIDEVGNEVISKLCEQFESLKIDDDDDDNDMMDLCKRFWMLKI